MPREVRVPASMAHELNVRFTYHPPTDDDTRRKYEELRAVASGFAHLVAELCPPSRETSLALTKIEEASMWANAAVARGPARETLAGMGYQPPRGL